ncbi:unnamed protein product [Scytosiphon promiscuus]
MRRSFFLPARAAAAVGPAVILLLLLLACSASAQDTSHSSHDSHDESSHESHGEEEGEDGGVHFEAAAVYDVGAGTNSLVAVPGEALEEETTTFAFMVVPAASADVEGLEGAEEDAEAAWDAYISGEELPTVLASGESAVPSAAVVYQIDLLDPLVLVPVDVTDAGAHAVFLEHGTDEVVTAFVSPEGVVLTSGGIPAVFQVFRHKKHLSSYSKTLLSMCCILVAVFFSFTGLLVVINERVARSIGLSHAFIFASGALLTASLLHIIPEALEGLEDEYESLHDLGLYAGVALLGGLSFSILVHTFLESGHSHGRGGRPHQGARSEIYDEGAGGGAGGYAGSALGTQPPSPTETMGPDNLRSLIAAREGRSLLDVRGLQPVCWNVIAGDLVHNFADGVTIGAAFLSCSATMGWTVTASAVLHEVPHELADFMALLNGGMSVKQAFLYNFLSALSAVLGTVIILALGSSLSDAQISIVLLLGAGSFIFIALSELLPEALGVSAAASKRGASAVVRAQVLKLGSFLVGALLIGVPLIFDQHCSSGHDGHDH